MVIQHSAEGSFLLHLCQIESSCRQEWRFLPEAQLSILNAPTWGWLAASSLSLLLWVTKVYYSHDLLSLASSITYRHCIWKISTHALVKILVLVPELIMGNEFCLQAPTRLSFLVHVSIINSIGVEKKEGFTGDKSRVVYILNTECSLCPSL